MPPALITNIFYNKGALGLARDAALLSSWVVAAGQRKPTLLDPQEPPQVADLQFHLEVPIYGAVPWGRVNVLVVNPEWWKPAWDPYVPAYDVILCKDQATAASWRVQWPALADRILYQPWSVDAHWGPAVADRRSAFVAFLGGSPNKFAAMKTLLGAWRAAAAAPAAPSTPSSTAPPAPLPPLTIYTTRQDYHRELTLLVQEQEGVRVECRNVPDAERQAILCSTLGHVVVSEAEGFGFAAAESEACGGFTILSDIGVWREQYSAAPTALLEQKAAEGIAWVALDPSAAPRDLAAALDKFRAFCADPALQRQTAVARAARSEQRTKDAKAAFLATFAALKPQIDAVPLIRHRPPILEPKDCPPITVVTPTRNRGHIISIAFHNMLATDYPRGKIEWVIVEDSDVQSKGAAEKIVQFQLNEPQIKVRYIPLPDVRTIGEKRNIGVEHATADVVLFMDDDDCVPPTGFRRRVAWLTRMESVGASGVRPRAAACTTLALYDLLRGVSAVNTPPWDAGLSQRISEATLTFYKSFWEDRAFEPTSVAEGEAWVRGRELEVIEIPPQQILVAFGHGQNATSRRIPAVDGEKPSCFWGFPREYLKFIHGLVGVKIEETAD